MSIVKKAGLLVGVIGAAASIAHSAEGGEGGEGHGRKGYYYSGAPYVVYAPPPVVYRARPVYMAPPPVVYEPVYPVYVQPVRPGVNLNINVPLR